MAAVPKKIQKDLKTRFVKAEYAGLGVLLVLVFFLPLIALCGFLAYGAYKVSQHKGKKRR